MNEFMVSSSREMSPAELGELIVNQLKASGVEPLISNTIDLLKFDSNELLGKFKTHGLTVSYKDVELIKSHVANSLVSKSKLPDLFPSQDLPQRIFFGNSDFDRHFPSISHPSFLELKDIHNEGLATVSGIAHEVAMALVIASASEGSKVLLLDVGLGTEIEQTLMLKCTDFCQCQRNATSSSVEQFLENIQVQRCYDPYAVLGILARLQTLQSEDRPDVVILMDWMKLTLPFMTDVDLLQHRQYFGLSHDNPPKRTKHRSNASLQSLLSQIVLLLQNLTIPGLDCQKATSVVIVNSQLNCTQKSTLQTGSASWSNGIFSSLLTDCLDYSLWLSSHLSESSIGNRTRLRHFAELRKYKENSGNSAQCPSCYFNA